MEDQQQPGTWREGHLTTAAELAAMTPQQRHQHFLASLVTPDDIDAMPDSFQDAVVRVRARGRALAERLIAGEGTTEQGHREAS